MQHLNFRGVLRSVLLLSLVAVFATGCGDSRDDFVALDNNGQTGNLVFRFQQAVPQTVDTVPAGTTTLRFDLYAGSPPSVSNFVETRTEPYADVITLTNVPSNVTTVIVTAFNSDNIPTVTLQGNAPVDPANTVEVNLDDSQAIILSSIAATPDPATAVSRYMKGPRTTQLIITGTFSNGSVVELPISNTTTSFSFQTSGIVNISSTGVVSPNRRADNTTATATYTIGSTMVSDTFTVRKFDFFPHTFFRPSVTQTGGYNGGYVVDFFDDDGRTRLNVNQTSTTTYAFADPAPTGLSINSSTGELTSTGTTPLNNFNVTVTWVDNLRSNASGETFTDCIEFRVVDPN